MTQPQKQVDTLELKAYKKGEYTHIHHELDNIAVDVEAKREKVMQGMNLGEENILTATEWLANDVKIKSTALTINKQVSHYEACTNSISKMCRFDEVAYFTKVQSKIMDSANEIKCFQ